MVRERLTDGELEYRRLLGARVNEAIRNAELNYVEIAEGTGEPQATVSRYLRGLRKINPPALTVIARMTGVTVADLLAVEEPLPRPARTGRCHEQYAYELVGSGFRVVILNYCDQLEHDREEDCHDPRGFSWRPDRPGRDGG